MNSLLSKVFTGHPRWYAWFPGYLFAISLVSSQETPQQQEALKVKKIQTLLILGGNKHVQESVSKIRTSNNLQSTMNRCPVKMSQAAIYAGAGLSAYLPRQYAAFASTLYHKEPKRCLEHHKTNMYLDTMEPQSDWASPSDIAAY